MKRGILVLGVGAVVCGLVALEYRIPESDVNRSDSAVFALASTRALDETPEVPSSDPELGPSVSAAVVLEPPVAVTERTTVPPSGDGRDLVQQARALFAERRLPEAEALALEATRSDPRSSRAWQILGRAQLARGAALEAESSFEYASRLDSTNAHALNSLGYTRLQRDDWEGARHALECAIALRDDVAYFHNNLGVAYERLGLLDLAAREYGRAIDIDPDHAKARVSLARVTTHLEPDTSQLASGRVDSSTAAPVPAEP